MDAVPPVADVVLKALVRQDFGALEAALAPGVRFRGLVPGDFQTAASAAETVACFQRWFGGTTDIELVDHDAVMLVDRLRLRYRLRLRKKGQPYLIEQSLWADVEDGRIAALDLLCSGFRPDGVAAVDASTHVFDAGDLGCGTGLPREFRTRLMQIPVGHVLEVVTRDPSAKEDLPSLARLLGHEVQSVQPGENGQVRIRVERVK